MAELEQIKKQVVATNGSCACKMRTCVGIGSPHRFLQLQAAKQHKGRHLQQRSCYALWQHVVQSRHTSLIAFSASVTRCPVNHMRPSTMQAEAGSSGALPLLWCWTAECSSWLGHHGVHVLRDQDGAESRHVLCMRPRLGACVVTMCSARLWGRGCAYCKLSRSGLK